MQNNFKSTFFSTKRNERNKQSKDEREIISIIEKDEVGRLKTLLHKKKFHIDKLLSWPKYRKHGIQIKPFFIAATRTESMVKFFLSSGASVFERTELGETALHFTAMYRASELGIVSILVDAGININAQDTDRKYTALHCACETRNHGIVRMLLENFANPDLKDAKGRLPIDIAKSVRCDQTVALLQRIHLEKKEDDFREFIRSTDQRVSAMEIRIEQQNVTQQEMQKSFTCLVDEMRSNCSLNAAQGRSSSMSDLHRVRNYDNAVNTNVTRQPFENDQAIAIQAPHQLHSQMQLNPTTGSYGNNGYQPTYTQVMNQPTFQYHVQQASMQPMYYPAYMHFSPMRTSSLQNVSYPPMPPLSRSASHWSINGSQQLYQEDNSGFDDSAFDRSAISSSALSLNDEHPDRPLSRKRYGKLQSNIQELLNHLKPEELTMKLFQKNILEHQVYDEIRNKSPYEQKRYIIMEIIMKGTNCAYNGFVDVVREQSQYLAGLLEVDFVDETADDK